MVLSRKTIVGYGIITHMYVIGIDSSSRSSRRPGGEFFYDHGAAVDSFDLQQELQAELVARLGHGTAAPGFKAEPGGEKGVQHMRPRQALQFPRGRNGFYHADDTR